jgi:methyl-accepting chemotaxis protein/methyl-accepting chemotaxis protein-1 (serine sensor receptor)
MTIGKKVGLCFSAAMLLSGTGGILSWYYVNGLGGRLDEAIHVIARQIELAGELRANVYTFRLQERGILLFSHIKAPQQVESCLKAYDSAMDKSFQNIRDMRALVTSDRDRQWLDAAEAGIRDYKTLQMEVRRLVAEGKLSDATESDRKNLVPTGARIIGALDHFGEAMHSNNAATDEEGARMRRSAKIVVLFILIACIPVGFIISVVMMRTARQLQRTASDLDKAAGQVASAAHRISDSSQSLAQAASEQAASIEQTSASSEEISMMAQRNTSDSQSAAETVDHSQRDIAAASTSLDEMIIAIGEIETSSGKISRIIKVIDEIAFQTNILALNAAVEAARAGEAGMGFAVVADEVRNLAQRCAQAARETTALIEDSIGKSHAGKQRVDRMAESIQALAAQGENLKKLVHDVSSGSREQCQGIDQIAKTIAQMEKVTAATASGSEESAAASEQLRAQAKALHGVVSALIRMVGGDVSHETQPGTSAVARRVPRDHAPQTSEPSEQPFWIDLGSHAKRE